MVKMTGIELELVSDIDISFFVEKGMIGGISYIALLRDIAKETINTFHLMIIKKTSKFIIY